MIEMIEMTIEVLIKESTTAFENEIIC